MSIMVLQLRRQENSQPWGLRLKGGIDQGLPLHVEHVQAKGRAASAGVMMGDMVLAICGTSTHNLTHQQVKTEMLRAGNDLDLTIQRDASLMGHQPGPASPVPSQSSVASGGSTQGGAFGGQGAEPRVVIDEQPICKLGGPTYKHVKPKTYQVLDTQLQQSGDESGGEAPIKPASIFDRKRSERSEYLKAKGSTIQKAFGE